MKKFAEYLISLNVEDGLLNTLIAIEVSAKRISDAIKVDDGGKAGTHNVFGEEQIALDVLSNDIVLEELYKKSSVYACASEELPDVVSISDSGEYFVCFDPLDGSSLVDVNLAVGSIFGIYKEKEIIGKTGRDQVASLMVVYGPRTTILLTAGHGVVEFSLMNGEFLLTKEDLKVGEGKMFAPGNLRACKYDENYLNLLNFWVKNQYTLRYSGGMVPDINQIILKGKGVFTYPGYVGVPNGKLRLLFECAPMAFLMEQAGGRATDGKLAILDKKIENIDQKTPILIGATKEVKLAEEYLG